MGELEDRPIGLPIRRPRLVGRLPCLKDLAGLLLALAMLLGARGAEAADCFWPRHELSTQSEVDRFQRRHGPCTELAGDLRISGPDIVSLAGLAAIARIDGDL